MKRFMTMMAAAVVSTAMFAANNNMDETFVAPAANYSITMNNDAIAKFLNLNEDQKAYMTTVHNKFKSRMQKAADKEPSDAQKISKRAILNDLCCMRTILDDEQFRNYRSVLNATVLNHNILYY